MARGQTAGRDQTEADAVAQESSDEYLAQGRDAGEEEEAGEESATVEVWSTRMN